MSAQRVKGEPIPVHVVGSDVPLAAPSQAKVRTEFKNLTVNDTNPVDALLPDDPTRICAYVQTTGGDVYLCDSKGHASSTTPQGSILPKANTAPWPIYGQGAVWVAEATGGSTCVVSVTAEYAITSE